MAQEITIEDVNKQLKIVESEEFEEYANEWGKFVSTFTWGGKPVAGVDILVKGIGYEINKGERSIAPIPGQRYSKNELFREHMTRQLVDLVNLGPSLYTYIDLKRIGDDGQFPSEIVTGLSNAKNKSQLGGVIIQFLRFVANEDRYRSSTELLTPIRKTLSDITNDKFRGLPEIKTAVEEVMRGYDRDNAIEIKANDSPQIPKQTKPQGRVDVLKESNRDHYDEIVALIDDKAAWEKQNDSDFQKTFSDAKVKWMKREDEKKHGISPQKTSTPPNRNNSPPQPQPQPTPIIINNSPSQEQQRIEELEAEVKELKRLRDWGDKQLEELEAISRVEKEETKKQTKLATDNITKLVEKDKELLNTKNEKTKLEKKLADLSLQSSQEKEKLEEKLKELTTENELLLAGNNDDTINRLKEQLVKEQTYRFEYEEIGNKKLQEKDDQITELRDSLSLYEKNGLQTIDENYVLVGSSNANKEDYVFIEKARLDKVLERIDIMDHIVYMGQDIKSHKLKEIPTDEMDNYQFYLIKDLTLKVKVKDLLEENQPKKGFWGELLGRSFTLEEQIKLAMREDQFGNSYRGSDRLTLSFLTKDELQMKVKISNLALQTDPGTGEKAYTIPMHDTESYYKVYEKFSPFGKEVIQPEGEMRVERPGFETLTFPYTLDESKLNGDLYHGRKLVYSRNGVNLYTTYMSEEHQKLNKIIIDESQFAPTTMVSKKSFSIKALPEPESEVTGEFYEVPIVQEEGEGDWPSGF